MPSHARTFVPLAAAAVMAAMPAPLGLEPHGWHYAALFCGVVLSLILEPVPPAATGLIGVTAAINALGQGC